MKCLILGYGYMGKIRHRVLKEHPNVSEIKIYDPYIDPIKENLGESYLKGETIPWNRFDAAFICTPNNVTAEFCVQALTHCGHVFCEKPPGRNWEEICLIVKAAEARPGHTIVFGFNHRLHPSVKAAKAMVGDGGLGEVLYIKGTYGKSGGLRYRESWRNRKDVSGGGILLDQGIHMLDIFQHLLGPMKVESAVLVDAFWECDVEDNAFVLLKSQKGVPAFLHSSATLWKHTFRFEIGCHDGYLVASGLLSKTGSYGREQLVIGRRQFEDEAFALGNPREEILYFDKDDSWKEEVDEFLSAVKERRRPTHGLMEEAQHVFSLIRDVYQMKKKEG
ncbi:MAG: Gfo/Idh/MocA family oxidoreductase [Deltaproteobacteria bacterium]|nr:Gfo/Idh/MocA family oxidoreductase [Deltaproteobacteria bacterium]